MKPLYISFFLISLVVNHDLYAQEKIVITKRIVTMSQGDQPAFIVIIPQSKLEDVSKAWEKRIRQNTKSKVEEKNNETIILNTQIIDISRKPINIYSAILHLDSAVKLIALFEIDSIFFDYDNPSKVINFEKTERGIEYFLHEFAVDQYKYAVQNELKEEDKKLKQLNSDLKKLIKNTESLHKTIKENEGDSINTVAQIKSLESDKERKQLEINNQKINLSYFSTGDEMLKEEKKKLKRLEKERKSIEKDIEKLNKKIVEYHISNIEAERMIEENEVKKQELLDEISVQEKKTGQVMEKLQNIK